MRSFLKKAAAAVVVAGATAPVFAAGPDYSAITGAIDFSGATTAVLSVIGLLAGVYLAVKGGTMILGLLRGK